MKIRNWRTKLGRACLRHGGYVLKHDALLPRVAWKQQVLVCQALIFLSSRISSPLAGALTCNRYAGGAADNLLLYTFDIEIEI